MNVSFDGTELSTLGVSVRELKGKSMPGYQSNSVDILGGRKGEAGEGRFANEGVSISGNLSANTEDWVNFTHADWLNRLNQLKVLLNPELGYKVLVVTGDEATKYRYCRFESMDLNMSGPAIFKRPFFPITLNFESYEPYWRTVASTVTSRINSTDFDGNDDRITTSYNPFVVNSSRTFMGWAYRDTNTTSDVLFGSSSTSVPPVLALSASSQDVTFKPQNSTTTTWTNAWPGNNQWVHWALTFNDTTNDVQLFINGNSVGSSVINTQAYNATPGNFQIGSYGSTTGSFDGKMAMVSVWESILDVTKIRKLMWAYDPTFIKTVDTPSLLLPLDNVYLAADQSGNSRNGTGLGGVSVGTNTTALHANKNGMFIPNLGHAKTRPVIKLKLGASVVGTASQPEYLFTFDDSLFISWSGVDTTVTSGQEITIDSETLVMSVEGPTLTTTDYTRYYDYFGNYDYTAGGFPLIDLSGSRITTVNPKISEISVSYDELRL